MRLDGDQLERIVNGVTIDATNPSQVCYLTRTLIAPRLTKNFRLEVVQTTHNKRRQLSLNNARESSRLYQLHQTAARK